MKKEKIMIPSLVLSVIPIILIVFNILNITDRKIIEPIIWFIFSFVNIRKTIDCFQNKMKDIAAFYIIMSALAVFLFLNYLVKFLIIL